jgi:hypothetical protein
LFLAFFGWGSCRTPSLTPAKVHPQDELSPLNNVGPPAAATSS